MHSFLTLKHFKGLFTKINKSRKLKAYFDNITCEIKWENKKISTLYGCTFYITEKEIIINNKELEEEYGVNYLRIKYKDITHTDHDYLTLWIYFIYKTENEMELKIQNCPLVLRCHIHNLL
ncbi:hypothetical protein EHP00_1532 [Ecytonucleospora hepatopenaei]|uniref:Uncharacterized protein n=1 Tax=Ecytonucleospora hepatopenaei TaxID=646526 RepID=A0A1W0E395_9MICR|nr:hypothetical protein EHP00_1532 [Ecytonucleospora hepatopenaei]